MPLRCTHNKQHLGIDNVCVLQSNWFSALQGQQFDMIVSNPPYIDEQDPHLAQGDVRFEPLSALVAGDRGLADTTCISLTSLSVFNAAAICCWEVCLEQLIFSYERVPTSSCRLKRNRLGHARSSASWCAEKHSGDEADVRSISI